jgi:hypothetical protein
MSCFPQDKAAMAGDFAMHYRFAHSHVQMISRTAYGR